MSMHRKNKDSGSSNSAYNARWFTLSVLRRRKRNVMAKLSRKFGRFTRTLMKKARKRYIQRVGVTRVIADTERKYMRMRLQSGNRGMDGTMR